MWLFFIFACAETGLSGCERAFLRDADGDGWGSEADVALACSAPKGYVEAAGDCDDADIEVNPGAVEVCDGRDNDCDGDEDDDDPSVEGGSPWYRDHDGDGFGDEQAIEYACELPRDATTIDGDCDDDDASVNPGELESCNGRDDDCDTLVDEEDPSLAIGPSWYPDQDGDGYGDEDLGELSCDPVEGAIEVGGDCEDADPAVNPGALEVCDGIDNNCDHRVDDDDPALTGAPVWYGDTDGDGHGYRGDDTTACEAPDGAVPFGDDCDDTDPRRSPSAEEVCGDGVDQDCDGVDLPCV